MRFGMRLPLPRGSAAIAPVTNKILNLIALWLCFTEWSPGNCWSSSPRVNTPPPHRRIKCREHASKRRNQSDGGCWKNTCPCECGIIYFSSGKGSKSNWYWVDSWLSNVFVSLGLGWWTTDVGESLIPFVESLLHRLLLVELVSLLKRLGLAVILSLLVSDRLVLMIVIDLYVCVILFYLTTWEEVSFVVRGFVDRMKLSERSRGPVIVDRLVRARF